MSLPEENPNFTEMLHNRWFSVDRTGNSVSRVGVDMALEQTINAEAKSWLKSMTDVASAINRRVVTNSCEKSVGKFLTRVDWLKAYNW